MLGGARTRQRGLRRRRAVRSAGSVSIDGAGVDPESDPQFLLALGHALADDVREVAQRVGERPVSERPMPSGVYGLRGLG